MANLGSLGWLQAGASFVQLFGLLEQGKAARIAGERARTAAAFNARQAEREAILTVALSQRQAAEERRQSGLVASRALAVAAASGGGVSDPTIVRLIAAAKGEGAYRAGVALYQGEARARQLRIEGVTGRVAGAEAAVEGRRSAAGYSLAAAGAVAKGFGGLYAKYGMNGPTTGSGDAALLGGRSPDTIDWGV